MKFATFCLAISTALADPAPAPAPIATAASQGFLQDFGFAAESRRLAMGWCWTWWNCDEPAPTPAPRASDNIRPANRPTSLCLEGFFDSCPDGYYWDSRGVNSGKGRDLPCVDWYKCHDENAYVGEWCSRAWGEGDCEGTAVCVQIAHNGEGRCQQP